MSQKDNFFWELATFTEIESSNVNLEEDDGVVPNLESVKAMKSSKLLTKVCSLGVHALLV